MALAYLALFPRRGWACARDPCRHYRRAPALDLNLRSLSAGTALGGWRHRAVNRAGCRGWRRRRDSVADLLQPTKPAHESLQSTHLHACGRAEVRLRQQLGDASPFGPAVGEVLQVRPHCRDAGQEEAQQLFEPLDLGPQLLGVVPQSGLLQRLFAPTQVRISERVAALPSQALPRPPSPAYLRCHRLPPGG